MSLLAEDINQVFGTINPPPQISNYTKGSGASGLSAFISVAISLVYVAAGLVFIFMIITAAFQWITSGGDKDAVGKARARITNAIIGIVLLSLTALILNVFGSIVGFHFFSPGAAVYSPDPCVRTIGAPPPCP